MMKRFFGIGLIAFGLVACGDTNPLTNPGTDSDLDLLPGSTGVTANSPIERYEEEDGSGDGYAQSITYDETSNTFSVDNLAFDANNVYTEESFAGTDMDGVLAPFRVYENAATYSDSVTGAPINQLTHKAIYGVSTNTTADGDPVTEFAIVRTGAYVGYGFGGFMYKRNDGVVLPVSGQATFSGDYAGLRDFNNRGGIEYATGTMTMDIDFADFNEGAGVKGRVTNRRIFDVSGTDITGDVTTALGVSALPTLVLTIGPGVADANGEMTGGIGSTFLGTGGALEVYEEGNYYAVLSGDGATMEVVGVVVVTGDDPRWDGVTFRETGGFILYR